MFFAIDSGMQITNSIPTLLASGFDFLQFVFLSLVVLALNIEETNITTFLCRAYPWKLVHRHHLPVDFFDFQFFFPK